MSKLHFCVEEMTRNWQSLASSWDAVSGQWKDTDRDSFERQHINELRQTTQTYIAALQQLVEAISSIERQMP